MSSASLGFVKIHRSLLEWEWYHDDRCVRLFLHLLLKANHSDRKWQGEEVLPGQLVTSSIAIAGQLGWSRSAVNRTLDKLKKTGEVDTKSDTKWTLVTLVNWAKWQNASIFPDSKPDKKRTRTGQQTGLQPDTTKEGKEFKNGRITPQPPGVVFPEVLDTDKFREAWGRWEQHRKEIKQPLTPTSIGQQLKRCEELGVDAAVAALDNTILKGWQGLREADPPRQQYGQNGHTQAGYGKEQADAEMRRIRIAHGRDPDWGAVEDSECSRELLIFRGRIKA